MLGGIRCACAFCLSVLVSFTVGCGGGGGGGAQPLPAAADFSISILPASLSVAQGTTSAPVAISITSQNGFTGSVQVTLSGVPAGVTANPSVVFSVAAGQSANVLFGADSSSAAGQFSVVASGISGSLSHSANLGIIVQPGVLQNLPRTAYIENDSVASLDNPSSEPHRRHIVYDPAGQRFFVANRAMNRVEVYSALNPMLQTTIDASAASSVDLSPDGTTLWVGTATEQILAINTVSLQVTSRYPVSALTPIPNTSFSRPTEVVALANGKLFVRLRQPMASESLLALWDPVAGNFTDLTSSVPGVFQAGLGVMARTRDRSRILLAANDNSGQIALLDNTGKLLAGPQAAGTGHIVYAAASPDGSRFAIALSSSNASQVVLLDANLNPAGSYVSNAATSLVFSRDGQTLFVGELLGNASVITSLSATNLSKVGQSPDIPIQGVPSVMEDSDASNLLCALANRGVSFLDAASPVQSLPPNAPSFASAPVGQPSEGPNSGGTAISLVGTNFTSNPELRFGSQNPVNATAASTNQLQATTVANAASGPTNLIAYFSNGWLALAPNAFSFGPKITQILPNAGSAAGGDTITILGYGFGPASGSVTVSIGGQSATVQKLESVSAFAKALALDSTFPFAMERITVTAPPGTPGKADISISAASGTTAAPKSFQYVTSSQTFTAPALHKFILYDQSRQRLYLSSTAQVDLFDLASQSFSAPLALFPGGPPPNAGLRGLTLTPDSSQLIVADFGGQSIYLADPSQPATPGTKIAVGGVTGFASSGPARVTATNVSTVFVGLSGEGGSSGVCSGCLGQLNMSASAPTYEPAPQPEVTSVTGAPLMQADASGDTVYLSFGNSTSGPVALWNAATPNAFTVSTAKSSVSDLTTCPDGNVFAVRSGGTTEIRGSDLSLSAAPTATEVENISGRIEVPGSALHPSGALLYEPFLDGPAPGLPPATGIHGGIDIRDAHNGRLRLRVYLPEPFAMLSTDIDGLHGGFLAIDENGQRLFALTTSGLTIVQLASVPLGIGAVIPATGPSAGGTNATIRGSGFQSATRVTLGGKSLAVTFKDQNTLTLAIPPLPGGPQQLVISNPDGETVSLDAAFLAQ
ncbi:MAG TPA: IPT/TIG domain-containing protein [Candidatus Acidoferrum sp.]